MDCIKITLSTTDLHSIVVRTSVSHPGDPGSIPRPSKLVHIFIKFFQKYQTLRAKITPCPCPKLQNFLISHSHDLKEQFKAITYDFYVSVYGSKSHIISGTKYIKCIFGAGGTPSTLPKFVCLREKRTELFCPKKIVDCTFCLTFT